MNVKKREITLPRFRSGMQFNLMKWHDSLKLSSQSIDIVGQSLQTKLHPGSLQMSWSTSLTIWVMVRTVYRIFCFRFFHDLRFSLQMACPAKSRKSVCSSFEKAKCLACEAVIFAEFPSNKLECVCCIMISYTLGPGRFLRSNRYFGKSFQ